jgi:ADP-dependent NAD(P)H-hydrate dehydratase
MNRSRSATAAPTPITPRFLRAWPLPQPDGARGKDGRGAVLIVGGCVQVPGAVILSAMAALRVGAGRLTIATARPVAPLVGVVVPEARVIGLRPRPSGELATSGVRALATELDEQDALLIGPGVGVDGRTACRLTLRACFANAHGKTIVVDAGALDALTTVGLRPGGREGAIIATPHAEEMARLSGRSLAAVLRRPLETAREVAETLGIHVVMKGETTYVVPPHGRALVNRAGSVGLGTSGSGDVLAGAIAGLAARGASPVQAAAWGVHVHARAGEALARRLGPLGFVARELLDDLPPLLARFQR